MRRYRVTLTSPKVGTMMYMPVAHSYKDAEYKAWDWATHDPEHSRNGPWVASDAEVTA